MATHWKCPNCGNENSPEHIMCWQCKFLLNDVELNKTADIQTLRKLYQHGVLSREAFSAAKSVLRPASEWFFWIRKMLLFVGSTLVLAGIIFFFAYNWEAMGKFLKFGLIEAGMIACVCAAYLKGEKALSGKVFLLSSSVLVGVLLAVYGQTYQTGADAFGLFISWAVLISGWVLISEFTALWFVWMVLINVGMILYWSQVGHPAYSIKYGYLCLAIALVNSLALFSYELGIDKGLDWLKSRWFQGTLLIAILTYLSIPTIDLIVDFKHACKVSICFAALLWLLAAIVGYVYYRFKRIDMLPIAIIIMNACVILLTFIGEFISQTVKFREAPLLLLFALIIVGVVSGAVYFLRKTAEKMQIK